jgi:RND family efflux transporter MFP subunit
MKNNVCNTLAIRLVFCFLTAILFNSCFSKSKKIVDNQEKFQVISPAILDTVYTNEYVAEIQSVQNVEIRARVKGFIERIYVDEGKPVRAGQVLFTLDNKEFKEDLLQATAQLKSALAELKSVDVEMKNTRLLVDKNIVSKSELETAQAKKDALEAKIEETKSAISIAKLNLSFTQIKAPFSGVINRIPNKAGSLVEEGTLLTTISDNREVFAYFNISEKDYLDYIGSKKGNSNEVSLILSNGSFYNHKGTIETSESEFNKNTGNIAFRAKFPNPEQILKHGSSGKVLVKNELKNAMVIPQKSTFEVQENTYVYVVNNDSTVHMRKIIPSVRLPHLYVISSGLNVDDKIIYEGIQQVKEGDRVITEKLSLARADNL